MNYALSGYYGYGNAGDEAVLAAILEAVGARSPKTRFTVFSGDPAQTVRAHGGRATIAAVPRQAPSALLGAIRGCDVFISGGGSLLQDVTSLRNVVYYTTLIRFAQLSRKPTMIYAQGIGPLRRKLSCKLARAAMARASCVTVRDEASKELLRRIGVRREIEVTADPVWALAPPSARAAADDANWALCLRPWPGLGVSGGPAATSSSADGGGAPITRIRAIAQQAGARVSCIAMQPRQDGPAMRRWGATEDELLPTESLGVGQIMGEVGQCKVAIAMRLHALIFAAVGGVPCVAIDYDPKVRALAGIIGAPLLPDLSEASLRKLPGAVARAQALPVERRHELAELARRNADLAVELGRANNVMPAAAKI